MKTYHILLSIGKDRPGIVNDVSSVLFEHGANIEDSRMAAMGGCFSIMTLFSCTLASWSRSGPGWKTSAGPAWNAPFTRP